MKFIAPDWKNCINLDIEIDDKKHNILWCCMYNKHCPADNKICHGPTSHHIYTDDTEYLD